MWKRWPGLGQQKALTHSLMHGGGGHLFDMRKAIRTKKIFTFSAGDQFTNRKERPIKRRGGR